VCSAARGEKKRTENSAETFVLGLPIPMKEQCVFVAVVHSHTHTLSSLPRRVCRVRFLGKENVALLCPPSPSRTFESELYFLFVFQSFKRRSGGTQLQKKMKCQKI
jgi:hypothetical protein